MRSRILLTFLLAFLFAPLALGPAAAEPEPDNWIWQATGPVTSGVISGTMPSDSDADWYMFYAASQTQLAITYQPKGGCDSRYDIGSLRLTDAHGEKIAAIEDPLFDSLTIAYTTPVGTTQFFIEVKGCDGHGTLAYSATISPASALMSGPPMPEQTLATGEPNETTEQAQGPLTGDAIYTGVIETFNDQDWFYFYANAPFSITSTCTSCNEEYLRSNDVDINVYSPDSDRYPDSLFSGQMTANLYDVIAYTPTAWQRFYVQIDGNGDVGGSYRFQIAPASSIQSGPALVPAPPAGVTGLKYRRVHRAIVVSWTPVQGATNYLVRKGKGPWATIFRTHRSYKRKNLSRGTKVTVMAANHSAYGPSRTIRIGR